MTVLQQLYANTASVIGGKTISVPRLTEIADAEAECVRSYLARIKDASEKAMIPIWAQETMYQEATRQLQVPMHTGSTLFNRTMFGSSSGILYLGWLSLRVKEPAIKPGDANTFITNHPEAVFEVEKAWGSGKNLLGLAEMTTSGPTTSNPETTTGTESSAA